MAVSHAALVSQWLRQYLYDLVMVQWLQACRLMAHKTVYSRRWNFKVTEATRETICRILAWDLKQLEIGEWAFVDHDGKFHSVDSERDKLAGTRMPLRGAAILKVCFCSLKFL